GNVHMVFEYIDHDLTGILSQNNFPSPKVIHQDMKGMEHSYKEFRAYSRLQIFVRLDCTQNGAVCITRTG
ncbi:hypothetical protein BS47DRAFT_1299698, partial [Hydnum rufescens UP504]